MKKILVIEDNYEVRENIAEILSLSEYETYTAENGKVGVELAVANKPDLIICDIMMPELDGFGVLKILNRHHLTADIPFIFLTAKTDKTDFRKGMSLGADDYITKPFEDLELLEAVDIRLKKSERIKNAFDRTEQGIQRFFSEARARKEFENLSLNREIRKYQKKDTIYEEGQYPNWLFFVVSGKVKTFKINEFGKEFITHIYSDGEFFGFLPLISQTQYTENAKTLEDTELRLIPKGDFSLLIFSNRDFSAQFIKMLANQIDKSEQQLIELAYSSVRKKVANALITFATDSESEEIDRGSLLSNISREDLANVAGIAKETLIRTLSDFKAEGLIEITGSEINIIQLEKLKFMPH